MGNYCTHQLIEQVGIVCNVWILDLATMLDTKQRSLNKIGLGVDRKRDYIRLVLGRLGRRVLTGNT